MNHATLFIDESGKSSLAERADEPFILTGVILDDTEIPSVEGFFSYIKRKFEIELFKPFHSYHLFEHPIRKLTDAKATSLVYSLADFISLIPITVHMYSINKLHFRQALGVKKLGDFKGSSQRKELKEFPYRILATKLFRDFAAYLKATRSTGQITADSRKGGDQQLIKTLDSCKDCNNGPIDRESSKLIQERCTAICFAEKNFLSGGLEITDLISFVSFFNARRIMNSMDQIHLSRLWNEIRQKMHTKEITHVNEEEIRSFFSIKKGEVHKYLNST
jgi:hypothetical protein